MDEVAADTVAIIAKRVPADKRNLSMTDRLEDLNIDSFSAVINPPQGFILAIGKVTKVPVIDDGDQIVAGHRMAITMSCDHRVIDGALGAEYLKELRHLLENPALLLV